MRLPVSIVIPTYNEEKYLPKLLDSIDKQTVGPTEVIVSDAFSEDKTREIAKKYGCKVVDGGLPAVGRNSGAKVAKSEIILFLDADVVLPKDFLEKTISEMTERGLDMASCFLKPTTRSKVDLAFYSAFNYYCKITTKIHPHIPGSCIFIKKYLHQKINGFDETIVMCEDQDFVKRASKFGKFAFLKSFKIPFSERRMIREGKIKFALKYFAMEMHLIFLGKIKRDLFDYKLGDH